MCVQHVEDFLFERLLLLRFPVKQRLLNDPKWKDHPRVHFIEERAESLYTKVSKDNLPLSRTGG